MTITLTTELEKLVNEKVRSGAFESPADVILESLRLLEAREKGMEALRQEILVGVADIEQGRFTTYQTDTALDEFADKLIQQGQLKQKNQRS